MAVPRNILKQNKDVPFVDRILDVQKYIFADPVVDGDVFQTHALDMTRDPKDAKKFIVYPKLAFADGVKGGDGNFSSGKLKNQTAEEAIAAGNFIRFDNDKDAFEFTRTFQHLDGAEDFRKAYKTNVDGNQTPKEFKKAQNKKEKEVLNSPLARIQEASKVSTAKPVKVSSQPKTNTPSEQELEEAEDDSLAFGSAGIGTLSKVAVVGTGQAIGRRVNDLKYGMSILFDSFKRQPNTPKGTKVEVASPPASTLTTKEKKVVKQAAATPAAPAAPQEIKVPYRKINIDLAASAAPAAPAAPAALAASTAKNISTYDEKYEGENFTFTYDPSRAGIITRTGDGQTVIYKGRKFFDVLKNIRKKDKNYAPSITLAEEGKNKFAHNANDPKKVVVFLANGQVKVMDGQQAATAKANLQKKNKSFAAAAAAPPPETPKKPSGPSGPSGPDKKPGFFSTPAGRAAAPGLALLGLDVALESVKYSMRKKNRERIRELERKEAEGALGRDRALEQQEFAQMVSPVRAIAEQSQRETEATLAGMGESASPARINQLRRAKQQAITQAIGQASEAQSRRVAQRAAAERVEKLSREDLEYQENLRALNRFARGAGLVAQQVGAVRAAEAQRVSGMSVGDLAKQFKKQNPKLSDDQAFKYAVEVEKIQAQKDYASAMKELGKANLGPYKGLMQQYIQTSYGAGG